MKTLLFLPILKTVFAAGGGFGGSDHDYTIKVHAGKRDCYKVLS